MLEYLGTTRYAALLFASAVLFSSSSLDGAQAAIDDHKNPCKADQAVVINAAIKKSKEQMLAAAGALDNPTPAVIDAFTTWLGAPSSSIAAQVQKQLRMGAAVTIFTAYWCPISNNSEFAWENGDLAGVHPDSNIDVFFALDYFKLDASGRDSRASTVTHETMHQVGANLGPEVYDVADLKKLAIDKPADARANAQSFEYFVEDVAP